MFFSFQKIKISFLENWNNETFSGFDLYPDVQNTTQQEDGMFQSLINSKMIKSKKLISTK